MCGFAGFVAEPTGDRRALVETMTDRMAARGPDEATYFLDDRIALGFRRLSIVDLAGGGQPFWSEDGTLLAVVNGEIYNHLELREQLKERHTFRSRSDGEIVVHLFEELGTDCFALLNGIFAIAIWDTRSGTLTLARDHLGVKPLFYHRRPGTLFLFGSELKALLRHPDCPREPNWFFLARAEESTVRGVHALPGGEFAVLKANGAFTVTRYWSVADWIERGDGAGRSAQSYVDEYGALLEDAVKKQLMSDVPLGISLSGGLDSSLLTAIAAASNEDLHLFNIVADETSDDGGDREAARHLAEHLGISLHRFPLTHRRLIEPTLEDLEHIVWSMDGPFGTTETWSRLEAFADIKRRVPALKVVLLGQGSDEFAGGYTRELAFVAGEPRYANDSWRGFLLSTFEQYAHAIELDRVVPFLREEHVVATGHVYEEYVLKQARELQKYVLWPEDRTSSRSGIEARVPFLDPRLVELLVGIPRTLRSELFWDKQIVRRVAERWIPRELAQRHKIGFVRTKTEAELGAQLAGIVALFPKFREKYPIFSELFSDEVEAVHRYFDPADPRARMGGLLLFFAMQASIFYAQCRKPEICHDFR